MRGSSQPVLAVADDGNLYVVKIHSEQHPNLLFNEASGTELYRACGLPVPQWRIARIDDAFIDANRLCWYETPEQTIRPRAGLCFASLLLGSPASPVREIITQSKLDTISDRDLFWVSWLIDVYSEHVDRRQALFVRGADGRINPFFIDHGHMFGGPAGQVRPKSDVCMHLDVRVYSEVSSGVLAAVESHLRRLEITAMKHRLCELPDDWISSPHLQKIAECIEQLSDPPKWQVTLQQLTSIHQEVIVRGARRASLCRPGYLESSVLSTIIRAD